MFVLLWPRRQSDRNRGPAGRSSRHVPLERQGCRSRPGLQLAGLTAGHHTWRRIEPSPERRLRASLSEQPSIRLKRRRRYDSLGHPQRLAIADIGTSGRARRRRTSSMRTFCISSVTVWPVAALKRISASRREQSKSAKTSLGLSPEHARRLIVSTASFAALSCRLKRRDEARRTIPPGGTVKCPLTFSPSSILPRSSAARCPVLR